MLPTKEQRAEEKKWQKPMVSPKHPIQIFWIGCFIYVYYENSLEPTGVVGGTGDEKECQEPVLAGSQVSK